MTSRPRDLHAMGSYQWVQVYSCLQGLQWGYGMAVSKVLYPLGALPFRTRLMLNIPAVFFSLFIHLPFFSNCLYPKNSFSGALHHILFFSPVWEIFSLICPASQIDLKRSCQGLQKFHSPSCHSRAPIIWS